MKPHSFGVALAAMVIVFFSGKAEAEGWVRVVDETSVGRHISSAEREHQIDEDFLTYGENDTQKAGPWRTVGVPIAMFAGSMILMKASNRVGSSFLNSLSKHPRDKIMHMLIGGMIGYCGAEPALGIGPFGGAAAAGVQGVVKEGLDKVFKPGEAFATFAGGMMGASVRMMMGKDSPECFAWLRNGVEVEPQFVEKGSFVHVERPPVSHRVRVMR